MFVNWTTPGKRALLVLFSLFIFLISSVGLYELQVKNKSKNNMGGQFVLGIESHKSALGSPVRLIIPKLNVNARIQYIGVNGKGEMDVPSNSIDVGWFSPGTVPGDTGSAVIAGHLNGRNGEVGVFADLSKLKENDLIYVENDKGEFSVFVVNASQDFNPGFAKDVFNKNDGAYLNLVTCDGVWEMNNKSYSKRLIVFSEKVNL